MASCSCVNDYITMRLNSEEILRCECKPYHPSPILTNPTNWAECTCPKVPLALIPTEESPCKCGEQKKMMICKCVKEKVKTNKSKTKQSIKDETSTGSEETTTKSKKGKGNDSSSFNDSDPGESFDSTAVTTSNKSPNKQPRENGKRYSNSENIDSTQKEDLQQESASKISEGGRRSKKRKNGGQATNGGGERNTNITDDLIEQEEQEKSDDDCGKICKSDVAQGMYPGFHVGHATCNLPLMYVPNSMGWLWNLCDGAGIIKPGLKWKPGAMHPKVAANISKMKKKSINHEPKVVKTKKVEKKKVPTSEFDPPNRASLRMNKASDLYTLTMSPFPQQKSDDKKAKAMHEADTVVMAFDPKCLESESEENASSKSTVTDDSFQFDFAAVDFCKYQPNQV